jgi:hypothetical protein
MASAETTHSNEGRTVLFPHWKAALAATRFPPGRRSLYATEISRFLRYCQVLTAPVTAKRSREYLAIVPLVSARPNARLALRWFFQTARLAERRGRRARAQAYSSRHRTAPAPASRPENEVRDDAIAPRVEWFVSREEDPADDPLEDGDPERSPA